MTVSPRSHRILIQKGIRLLVFLIAPAAWLHAQEVPVPVSLQYSILLKTLSFDRNLKTRSGNTIVLGILYQRRYRQSLDVKDEMLNSAYESMTRAVEGVPIRVVPIDFSDPATLENQISTNGINTIYVAPLRSVDLGTICTVTRKRKVLTLTGVPEYVEGGVSIGVVSKGGRPSLFVNLPSAREEGANLDSQLLNLARTIK